MTKAVNNPAEVRLHRKLAIAEAKADMWQEKANELSVKLAEALQAVENVEREIVDVRAYNRSELDRFERIANGNAKTVEALNVENNGLRSIIRDLELTVERHRGYQDAQLDAQPPRMVPEPKELRRANWPYPQNELVDPLGLIGSRHMPSKPWWHK